jgi:hypothetical protein
MESLRLADLVVGLTVTADLGMGIEPGESARACLLAARLGGDEIAVKRADGLVRVVGRRRRAARAIG